MQPTAETAVDDGGGSERVCAPRAGRRRGARRGATMDLKARLWLSGKRRPTCTAEPGAPRIAEAKDGWIGNMLTELCG